MAQKLYNVSNLNGYHGYIQILDDGTGSVGVYYLKQGEVKTVGLPNVPGITYKEESYTSAQLQTIFQAAIDGTSPKEPTNDPVGNNQITTGSPDLSKKRYKDSTGRNRTSTTQRSSNISMQSGSEYTAPATGTDISPVITDDAETARPEQYSLGDTRRTVRSSRGIVDYAADQGLSRGNTEIFNKELQSHGVYDRVGSNWESAFSRVGIIDPYNTSTNTTEYVFFMKPDLHLYDAGGNINPDIEKYSPYLTDAIQRYPHIAQQLQYSASFNGFGGPLSPLLSNAFAGGLELPGISADTIDTPRNVYDENIKYRGTSYKSDSDFDFSTEMRDTKYLEIYHYFKMYDEYERLKWKGQVSPERKYIDNKILHDQTAIYKFIVAEDGMTLLYWARIVGTFPTSVPRENFSKIEGELNYTINWHGQFVRDMDPSILSQFNAVTQYYRAGHKELPLWDIKNHRFYANWSWCPYIYSAENNPDDPSDPKLKRMGRYFLRWTI